MTNRIFAIIDRHAGLYQWSGEAESPAAALAAFDADVGIDLDGAGLDVADWHIYAVTADQVAALEAWAAAGSPAASFPLAAAPTA